jgi:HK97 family phage major capsid protein
LSVEELVAAMQALVDQAKAPGPNGEAERGLTDEEMAEYERLEALLNRARKTEEIIKRQQAWKSVNVSPVVAAKTESTEEVERAAFRAALLGDKSMVQRAQSEGVGSAGGFLVPTTFRNQLVQRLKAFGGVMGGAEEITTATGEPLYWLTNDDTSNVGAITAEGANLPQGGADIVYGTRALGAYKYSSGGASNAPLKVSYELLQDSAFDITGHIASRLAERIGRKMADNLVNGTGAGEPTGLLSAAGGLTATSSWSSNTAPTYADLLNFVHTLDPAYRTDGCVWVFNDATLKLIRNMKDSQNRPLFWDASMNLTNGLTGLTLLGFPVIIDQACPTPGAVAGNNFGFFGNLKQAYVVRHVRDITMVTLNELFAANGQVGYMAWARMDAMVQDANAGVLLKAA